MNYSQFFAFSIIFLLSIEAYRVISLFTMPNARVKQLKVELLDLARKVNRGLTETDNDRLKIKQIFEELESRNKQKSPLSDPALNAVWELEYTTSDSILGKGGSPRVGPILQKIDAVNLKAQNSEVVRYFGFLSIPRSVTAELTPVSNSKVNVLFKIFKIGPFSIKAPSTFVGSLDVTYLDNDLRLSRGDKGNIFVLTKYSDI